MNEFGDMQWTKMLLDSDYAISILIAMIYIH